MNHLKDFRPSGDSVAARLRSTPAELLVEWEVALVELRRQYWDGTQGEGLCVLCTVSDIVDEETCDGCPWLVFMFVQCNNNLIPSRRISEIGRWLKRIRAEIRARGI